MQTILVTGGAGFIGSHICDLLITRGYQVVVVDNLLTGKKENLNPKVKFFEVDIRDPNLKKVFQECSIDLVCHQAAQVNVRSSINDPVEDASINIFGSLNLLECCRKFGIKKVVFASSGGAIYGDAAVFPTPEEAKAVPISPYGCAKLAAEYYLNYYYAVFKLPYIALRYSNVFGPRQDAKGEAGVIAIFTDLMLNNKKPVINGDGTQTRDFVYVSDVARANLLALESSQIGAFNIATGKKISINELFLTLKKLTSYQGDKSEGTAINGEVYQSVLDIARAKKFLNFLSELDLASGLREVIIWQQSKL